MNKRRERLSPVIDAERRKSGVLERRTNNLEAECAQLGRDLLKAREDAKASATRAEFQRANCVVLRTRAQTLQADIDAWKANAERAWAHNREFRDTPLWRIALQRLVARFGRSA